MAEAAAQFQAGLDQVALLPDTLERQRQELELCSALGAVLQAVKGFAAPETGRAFDRARELWERLGSPPEYLRDPYGQSRHHAFLRRTRTGAALGRRFASAKSATQRHRRAPPGHISFGLEPLCRREV